ncbi:uncharacterized protein LOC129883320 isoform X2 [Solanum dulcamara]|uniref:uncharacterized protein LOC129883320 isoform X2 n=1 Tax=Solanum dulcamara TaxID=45834 RepID=UPI002484EB72|nr:uncharacterized protein LOC129883320 isoform X2 [Solanum dulcamara]
MQSPIRHDRKRKQGGSRSSSIMEGQFTRSKSQIYLHCNRSGRVRVDSTRFKRSHHQLRQLDPPVKKPKRIFVQNPEVSSDLCEMSRTPIKDLRARRVFSPTASIVIENDENLKKGEFKEKNGGGFELNVEKGDETGNENVGVGNIGTESNGNRGSSGRNSIELSSGNVSIPKSNSAVSSSLRRKVFIAPSSYSYRRLLPYVMDASREYSEIETRDTSSKFNYPTLSYLKPHLRSTASNGSASVDKHVGASSDVSEPLGSVEGQKIEVNVSCNPQDLNDVPDVLSQTRVEPRVFANAEGLDPEVLEECVQTTPPDADIFLKANMSDLGVSIDHNAQQMEKKCAGHPSDTRNGCTVRKPTLTPGKNGSVLRNKLALNPCSRLTKVFKAAGSVSYRRLLPFLMDVAKNDPGGASSENGLPKFRRDLECNRPLITVTKEVPRNKEYSPKKDEIKEQETKLLEPNCTLANGMSDHLNTCITMEVSSSAAELFNKMPSSVFPDDDANPQTLLNVDITRKSETEGTDASNSEKSESECLNNFITGANFSGVLSSYNVSPKTSAGQYNIPNLLPISLEDLLSEYGVEDPKVEPVSPEGDCMTLEVDCTEENKNCGDLTDTVGIHANASESLKKKLFLKISEPDTINNESSCDALLVDRNGDSGGLDTVALIKASSSTEPSDLSGYGNDGPTKTLCSESIQEISQSEPIGCRRDCIGVDDNLNKNGCLEPAICLQKSTQTELSYDLVSHPDVLNKGILKRNPRGCRGLCNCLNCASFRLHAERAFEFSRNQMQDTEEVSLRLMKELADMRVFLEKRLSTEYNLAPIPLTQLEVDEACTKALEAEQRAKERLSQMNNELTYHCRVPSLYRPRVTFATCNEEKAVAKIESSSSKAGTKRARKKHHRA